MLSATQLRTIPISVAFCLFCLICLPADAQIRFDLPAQPLAQALTAVGSLANLNIYFDPHLVQGIRAPALKADLDADQALTRLLAGTRLKVVQVNANTIRVVGDTSEGGVNTSRTFPSDSIYMPTNVSLTSAGGDSVGGGSPEPAAAQEGSANADRTRDSDGEPGKKGSGPISLEEVVVTGSRLGNAPAEGAQSVSVYTRDRLESSGQTTLADFLGTLPSVSVSQSMAGGRTANGGGTVQLHGLPVGTTLVLINGRSVGTSSGQAASGVNIFDLNTIPAAAIERIEVIPTGSSAIYGSDAIAGVVNIVLRSNLDGGEVSGKYGGAIGTDYDNVQLAWGKQWSRGSFSLITNYERQTELEGSERAITSTNDFRPYGGPDDRVAAIGSPGNVFSVTGASLPGLGTSTYAAVPRGFQGTPTVSEFTNTAGTLNTSSVAPYSTLLPDFRRVGLLATGTYELTDSVRFFTELLYSEARQTTGQLPPYLLGLPTYQRYTVSASNPYNPFGVTVGIGKLLTEYGRVPVKTPDDFVRALVGARGQFAQGWNWEIATWDVDDHARDSLGNQLNPVTVQAALNSSNPSTALNPFIDGPAGSSALLSSVLGSDYFVRAQSRKFAANGFVRGSLLELPAGHLSVVLGSEYDSDKLDSDEVNYFGATNLRAAYHRHSYAIFSEARIPLLGSSSTTESVLAVTAAARYDHDQYFGGETTPQFGLEVRPDPDLLVRATYGRAFKVPTLLSLFGPHAPSFYYATDPRNGGAPAAISDITGGNAGLKPETGHSVTAGLTYKPHAVPGLVLSVTHWEITERDSIQSIDAQTIINNENLFPGRVVRNADGVITEVDSTLVNFGTISVRGLDYQLNWSRPFHSGVLETSAAATQTYQYRTALLPGLPPEDRVSQPATDLNWAPRWKGVGQASWTQGRFSSTVFGRYTGKYRDYLPLPAGNYQSLGNFWLVDLNAKVRLTGPVWLPTVAPTSVDLEIGAVNAFNRLPQYSNNPYLGYDGTQADIRGRFLYIRLATRW